MKQSHLDRPRGQWRCLRNGMAASALRTPVSAALAALALVFFAVVPWAGGQAPDTHELTLLHPEDPAFSQVLAANYPNIDKAPGFDQVRPFLVILENNSSRVARAYAIAWDVKTSDGVEHPTRYVSYIQKHFWPATERVPFAPGDVRLVGPVFLNLTPREYNAQPQQFARTLAGLKAQAPYSSSAGSVASSTASVDAVIFGDGVTTGPDTFHLVQRYRAVRAAERDEANAARGTNAASLSPEDAALQLDRDARAGLATVFSPTRDPASIYAQTYAAQRGLEAQVLLQLYRQGGDQALRGRLDAIARHPQDRPLTASPPALP